MKDARRNEAPNFLHIKMPCKGSFLVIDKEEMRFFSIGKQSSSGNSLRL